MRYSSALVLSTLAVGQAAAGGIRHASFHARRQAEKRAAGYENVDWKKVSYDLSNVDWSSVFAKPEPTPAPKPASSVEVKVEAVETPSPTPTPTPTPEPAYTPPASSTKEEEEEKPAQTKESSNPIEEVTDFLQGVSSVLSRLGISQAGVNSKTPGSGIWIGEGDWSTTFTNGASEDIVLFCWQANGFSGMSLNVNQPAISVGLKKGEQVKVSFAPQVPSACAPAYPDTKLGFFGGLDETWFELTTGSFGAFDISRNINMNGHSISAKGSKCTSDMETCVFKCKNGLSTCEKGTDYDLYNCSAANGGGGGFDTVMQGTGGGCSMGADNEHIEVTFS